MTALRSLRLTTGFEVPLDGDLLAIVEALYREVTLRNALNASFDAMRNEILGLIDQMSDAEKREYLCESIFLNTVTYENERLAAYVRNLAKGADKAASGRSAKKGRSPRRPPRAPASPNRRKVRRRVRS